MRSLSQLGGVMVRRDRTCLVALSRGADLQPIARLYTSSERPLLGTQLQNLKPSANVGNGPKLPFRRLARRFAFRRKVADVLAQFAGAFLSQSGGGQIDFHRPAFTSRQRVGMPDVSMHCWAATATGVLHGRLHCMAA